MRAVVVAAFAACAGVSVACGGKGHGAPDATAVFDTISVEPAQASVTVPLGGSALQTYQVFGVHAGERTELTASCTLDIAPGFGMFNGATVKVAPRGGKALVTATCGAQSGTAELAVNLTGSVVVGPNTPPGAPGLFGGATATTDASRTPAIEYPIDLAVAPVNIPPIEIQWKAAGNDLFHVTLTSTYAAIDVYTSDLQATLGPSDWDAITSTVAGSNLAIVVEGLAQATPQTKYASAGVKLTMSHDTVDKTAIYYWASSKGNIMSQTFGDPSPPSLVKDDCTSCHALSRSGSRLGYSRCVGGTCGASLMAGFMRYDPSTKAWTEPVNANDGAIHGSFSTFSPIGNPFPTDAQSLAIVSMANGTLSLYDPDTGAKVASNLDDVSTHGPGAPRSALMADWSADGTKIVFASTPHPGQWIDLSDGSIAIMNYVFTGTQHLFGEPQMMVSQPITLPGGTYSNFFFPSFSPDGKLIVFDAARAAWRANPAASAGQRLMLAAADGSWVHDLTALNGGDGDTDITWPHWAPGSSNDYYWVVFSSERDYGHEVTAANTAASCKANGVSQCKQIWIAAIAKNKLAAGATDPSAPPMWLPGQDPQTDNISPYWTVPVTEVK